MKIDYNLLNKQAASIYTILYSFNVLKHSQFSKGCKQ